MNMLFRPHDYVEKLKIIILVHPKESNPNAENRAKQLFSDNLIMSRTVS